jgi:hypothetical protein
LGPNLALRLLEFVARHGIRLSPEAEQRIDARLPRDYFTNTQPLWPVLSQTGAAASAHPCAY